MVLTNAECRVRNAEWLPVMGQPQRILIPHTTFRTPRY
jgi:hypothetical protein